MTPEIEITLRQKLQTKHEEHRAYRAAYNVLFNKLPYESLLFITNNRLDEVSKNDSPTYLETLNSLLPLIDSQTEEQKSIIFFQNYRLDGWENALRFVLEKATYLEQIEIELLDSERRMKANTPVMQPTTSVYNYRFGYAEGLRYCLSIMNAE